MALHCRPSLLRVGLLHVLLLAFSVAKLSADAEDGNGKSTSAIDINVDLESYLGEKHPVVEPMSPRSLTSALSGKCVGPSVVFFSTGMVAKEVSQLKDFGEVAEELDGLACFKAMSCRRWQDECANYNVNRAPAILFFPTWRQGPAYQYFGKMEHRPIAAEVMKHITSRESTFGLSMDNLDNFFKDTLRPIKVILISSRKSTPLIFQALSQDTDLWPNMAFGFGVQSDKALAEHFKVKAVPWVGAQCGKDEASREIYPEGKATFRSLRNWLMRLVFGNDAVFQGCLAQALLDAEAPAEEVYEVPDLEEEEEGGDLEVPYQKLAVGAAGCPPGAEIKTVKECEDAINALGLDPEPRWVSTYPGLPQGCSFRDAISVKSPERMHFNSAQSGTGRNDLRPICKVVTKPSKATEDTEGKDTATPSQSTPTIASTPASPSTPSTPKKSSSATKAGKVPELSKHTHRELFGKDGFCLIYLRQGRITHEESQMLEVLMIKFGAQLLEQGTKLRVAWMDVSIEQRLGRTFAMKSLPSAVILNPHKRPRFAAVKHKVTEAGESLPAREGDIAQLISRVLAGEARFATVRGLLPSMWAERSPASSTETFPTIPSTGRDPNKEKPPPKKKQKLPGYRKLQYGAEGCSAGMEIKTVEECEKAIRSLGIDPEPRWVANYPMLPAGCSVREGSDDNSPERMHYNAAEQGKGRKDLAPICKRDPSRPAESASAPAEEVPPAPPAALFPELAGRTHRELFGTEGYCLVYLKEGKITKKEAKMLTQLEKQLAPQVKAHDMRLSWAWMNVHVERKLASVFDMEVFPSAVVIDPHDKPPRFTPLVHEESEGEPLPADEEGLMLLVNMLLSGDTEFRPLPPSRLTVWADGTTTV
eukprot:CAMPEP_0172812212 /NCGR_PEP_ID=MMETSP1075-20121228/9899_1 /TAXON_ID=2916 /ORGANISM="Ceratium fusus, Strain PA161109" /LENGTH=873 /DNA_ID=CAMNT_0013651741 /DNA_START=28 /DNA_END=2649 /DNA_ORIENTATION=-